MRLLTEQGTPGDQERVSLLAFNYLALFDYAQPLSPYSPLVNHWPIHQMCVSFYYLL